MKKEKIVVLNPLIKKILNEKDYKSLLMELEYWKFDVTDPIPGIMKVKENYKEWVNKKASKLPGIDSRCPYVVDMIHKEFPHLEDLVAPIDPILITGAEIRRKEFEEKYSDKIELHIVAPCKGFEKYTTYDRLVYTWQDFKDVIHFYPQQQQLEESPVPLGFFDSLGVKVYSASGEEGCRSLLKDYPKDVELLELLFCEGGCHKGDGL